jgi:hypothetical protein
MFQFAVETRSTQEQAAIEHNMKGLSRLGSGLPQTSQRQDLRFISRYLLRSYLAFCTDPGCILSVSQVSLAVFYYVELPLTDI